MSDMAILVLLYAAGALMLVAEIFIPSRGILTVAGLGLLVAAVVKTLAPANPTPSEVAIADPYSGLARVGDLGEAAGPLHPAGKARFGSQLVDVVTQGEYLDAGAKLEVIERRGNRVVVRVVK